MFLGWTEDRGGHFYIRQLRYIKIKPMVEVLDTLRLERYAEWWAGRSPAPTPSRVTPQ